MVAEILRLLDLLGSVRVATGATHALPDEATPVPSEGSRFIVEQASAAEDRLFIAFPYGTVVVTTTLTARPFAVEMRKR